jgi:peptidyl-prolyl cis-trans isomerase D
MFFECSGNFDIAKFKEYFKSNPAQAQYLVEREKMLS